MHSFAYLIQKQVVMLRMKLLVLAVCPFIGFLCALTHALDEHAKAEMAFKEFVFRFNRTYVNDPQEYRMRLQVFKESLKRHKKLNEREMRLQGTAKYGINQFSDLSPSEFKDFLRTGYGQPQPIIVSDVEKVNCSIPFCASNKGFTLQKFSPLPDKIDWRVTSTGSKVTAVRNQGKCGGCWAFTAVETVESQWAIAGNPLTKLSIQEVISCAKGELLRGCQGGNTCDALLWLLLGNDKKPIHLVLESEYPFIGKDSKCKFSTMPSKGVKISSVCGCVRMFGCEFSLMANIVANIGPIGVNVDAVLWHDYIGGIIQHHCSNATMNHAVLIVGYDLRGPVPYWIIKNSWGTGFGLNGYLNVKMGGNICGVAEQPSFVQI